MAIQCRLDDHLSLRRCVPLNDAASSLAVHVERQLAAELEADCHSPLAVLAEPIGIKDLRVRVRVLAPDGSACLEADQTAPARHSRKLCAQIAKRLIAEGAKQILRNAARSAVAITES